MIKVTDPTQRQLNFAHIAINLSRSAFFWINSKGLVVEVNDYACQSLGYSREELLGLHVWDFDPDMAADSWSRGWAKIKKQVTSTFESRHRRKDGTIFLVEITSNMLEIEGEEFSFCFVIDITQRKQTETAMHAARNQLEATLQAIPDLMFELGIDGRYYQIYASRPELLAAPAAELIGKVVNDVLPASAADMVMSALQEAHVEGQSHGKQIQLPLAKGNSWFELSVARKLGAAGQDDRFIVLSRDISERKAAELALAESRNLLQTIIDTAPLRIFWKDSNLRYSGCNPLVAKDAGLSSSEDIIGKADYHLAWADQADAHNADYRSVIESGIPKLADKKRFTLANGRVGWFNISEVPLRNHGNEITGLLCIYDDITQEVAAREELRLNKEYFQRMFDNAPIGIAIADLDGRYLAANAAMCRMIGYSEEEIKRMTFRDITHPDDIAENDRLRDNLMHNDSDSFQMEKRYVRRDGSIFWALMIVSTIKGPDGKALVSIGQMLDIDKHKSAELALRQSEINLRAVMDNSPHLTWMKDAEGHYVTGNKVFAEYHHLKDIQQVEGKTDFDLSPRALAETYRADDVEVMTSRQQKHVEEQAFDGNEINWIETFKTPVIDPDGNVRGTVGFSSVITERKRVEEELRIAAVAFQSQEPMMITDPHGVILRINQAFIDSTGYTVEETVGQQSNLLQSGRHSADFYRAMWDSLLQTGGWQGEIWDRRKNGEIYPKWLTISAVRNDEGKVTHYIGTHLDITERKKAEQRIEELAFHDQLTGIPNRTLLLDRLKQAIAAGSRSGDHGALLFIDLDNFKTLNDTLGHGVGDLLLQQVAQRLKHCIREGDTVARLGGDEFVVVLVDLSTNQNDAAASAEVVAEKILASLNRTYLLGGINHNTTASIGITLFGADLSLTIDDLMRQADLAMYQSKGAGRNAWHFFDPNMEADMKERSALEADLLVAVREKQFLLHYQAQVRDNSSVTGAEVLVRWQHPQRGLVSPAEFVPLAEETGLILPLGQWVLETACTQLAIWAAQPEMAHLTIAVNVSARQFHQVDFVDQVLAILDTTGANPQRLKLELTESMLVEKVEDIIAKMSALKAKGVTFSLDDFGTGYSSLSYLKRMPLDQLKIDQSFVRDILTDPNDATIAITIVTLAQSLGLDVIAEGVETETQRDSLAGWGCYTYQGYYFSRPAPVTEFEAYVDKANNSVEKSAGDDFVI